MKLQVKLGMLQQLNFISSGLRYTLFWIVCQFNQWEKKEILFRYFKAFIFVFVFLFDF